MREAFVGRSFRWRHERAHGERLAELARLHRGVAIERCSECRFMLDPIDRLIDEGASAMDERRITSYALSKKAIEGSRWGLSSGRATREVRWAEMSLKSDSGDNELSDETRGLSVSSS